jgi:hypothetical protein
MEHDLNKQDIPLECYENCRRRIYPLKEAHVKFWQSNYAWLAIRDYYRWSIEEYTGHNDVFRRARKAGMKFGFYVHTSEQQPVTIDDAELHLNEGYELEQCTFVAWASRFNRIFKHPSGQPILPKKLWPFYYMEVPNGMGISRPAYKMHPHRTSFVIVQVDPDSPHKNIQVNWSLFLEEPQDVC